MPDSRRELAVEDVVTALGVAGKPDELTVHRGRLRPLRRENCPAAVVYLLRQIPSRPGNRASSMMQQNVVMIGVELRVNSETPDTALEPYVTWCETALCRDRRLGGTLIDDIELTQIDWGGDVKEGSFGVALMQFQVLLHSKVGDPTTL